MNSSVPRKSLVTNSLIDLLCDAAMPRQAFCSRPKEVQCWIWNCLAKQFSSKLQAAIPAEAKQSACSEKGTGTAQVISKPQSYNIVSPDLAVYGARMCYFYFFPWDVLFPLLFLQQFLSVPLKKKEKKKGVVTIKEMCDFPTVGHSLELIVKQLWCTLSIPICYVMLPQSVLQSDKTEEILILGLG